MQVLLTTAELRTEQSIIIMDLNMEEKNGYGGSSIERRLTIFEWLIMDCINT